MSVQKRETMEQVEQEKWKNVVPSAYNSVSKKHLRASISQYSGESNKTLQSQRTILIMQDNFE